MSTGNKERMSLMVIVTARWREGWSVCTEPSYKSSVCPETCQGERRHVAAFHTFFKGGIFISLHICAFHIVHFFFVGGGGMPTQFTSTRKSSDLFSTARFHDNIIKILFLPSLCITAETDTTCRGFAQSTRRLNWIHFSTLSCTTAFMNSQLLYRTVKCFFGFCYLFIYLFIVRAWI